MRFHGTSLQPVFSAGDAHLIGVGWLVLGVKTQLYGLRFPLYRQFVCRSQQSRSAELWWLPALQDFLDNLWREIGQAHQGREQSPVGAEPSGHGFDTVIGFAPDLRSRI